MEFYGKEKRIYNGIWIAFIALAAFPAIIFWLLHWAISYRTSSTPEQALFMSLGFAGLIGLLFSMICVFSGLLSDLFEDMIKRIRETIEFYGFFSKDGFSYYWHSFIHDGGPVMWGFIIFTLAYAGVSAFGFIKYFSI